MSTQQDYEALVLSLYAYSYGTITFLELIERFEVALGIRVLDKAELVDEQIVAAQTENK